MLTKEDIDLWNEYTKTVKPLHYSGVSKIKNWFNPRRWFSRRLNEIPVVLDLHQMTLEEAFHIFDRFLQLHFMQGTKKITVITGRGKDNQGKLKKEFPLWLENEKIKTRIKDFHKTNEGSFELELRKKC